MLIPANIPLPLRPISAPVPDFFATAEQLAGHVASLRKQAYIVLRFVEHANERARIVLSETIQRKKASRHNRKYCILSSVSIKIIILPHIHLSVYLCAILLA